MPLYAGNTYRIHEITSACKTVSTCHADRLCLRNELSDKE